MANKRLDREATVPATLKARVDHEAPEVVEPLLTGMFQKVLVVEHEKPDRFLVYVDGSEPRLWVEVSLGD